MTDNDDNSFTFVQDSAIQHGGDTESGPLHTGGMALATRQIQLDPVYCFRIVVFQVGNTIFRVPMNGFDIPGTTFEAKFAVEIVEGSSDDNPIVLLVDEDHFRGFLGAMYPLSGRKLTNSEWLGALDLATIWKFEEIRTKAIQSLDSWIETQSAKEAALLAKKYCVLKWLKAAYLRLLQQTPLTTEELTTNPGFDWETIGRLFCVKHMVVNAATNSKQTPSGGTCRQCKALSSLKVVCYCPGKVQDFMEQEFGGEFDRMSGPVPGPQPSPSESSEEGI